MNDIYTFLLETGGGTYISQHRGSSIQKALAMWQRNVDNDILKAFNILSLEDFVELTKTSFADYENLVELKGLKSAWFFYFIANDIDGHINIIKTV